MICFVFGPQNGFPQTRGAQFAVDKWTQMKRTKKNVKTAADIEQKEWHSLKKHYTCDKNKMRFLEVNFCENQNC